jgi:hypothetical protein
MYVPLTSHSSSSLIFSLPYALYMISDPGFDGKKLYEYSKSIGNRFDLSSVEGWNIPKKRLELVCFYQSVLGQVIYSRRRISIELLIEQIRSVFRINPFPTRGFHTVYAIVLLSVLLYQIMMVYYNCKTKKINPKSIKYMLGTGWWNGILKDEQYQIMTKPLVNSITKRLGGMKVG